MEDSKPTNKIEDRVQVIAEGSDALVKELIKEFELMFTRENLQENSILIMRMNRKLELGVNIIMDQIKIKSITKDEAVVKQALIHTKNVEFDQEKEIVTPKLTPKRNKIIINNIERSEQDEFSHFVEKMNTAPNLQFQYQLNFDKPNCARLVFNETNEATKFFETLNQNTFKEKQLQCEYETENIYVSFLQMAETKKNSSMHQGQGTNPGLAYSQGPNIPAFQAPGMLSVFNPYMPYFYQPMPIPGFYPPQPSMYIRRAKEDGLESAKQPPYYQPSPMDLMYMQYPPMPYGYSMVPQYPSAVDHESMDRYGDAPQKDTYFNEYSDPNLDYDANQEFSNSSYHESSRQVYTSSYKTPYQKPWKKYQNDKTLKTPTKADGNEGQDDAPSYRRGARRGGRSRGGGGWRGNYGAGTRRGGKKSNQDRNSVPNRIRFGSDNFPALPHGGDSAKEGEKESRPITVKYSKKEMIDFYNELENRKEICEPEAFKKLSEKEIPFLMSGEKTLNLKQFI